MRRISSILAVLLLLPIPGVATEPPSQAERETANPPSTLHDRQVQNLHTFAKLYGYVRFFHPSDQATVVDWDRFAIHGARTMLSVPTAELQAALEALFSPVAPTLRLYREGDEPPAAPEAPESDEGAVHVAWQHFGVGFRSWPYRSQRAYAREGQLPIPRLFEQMPDPGETLDKGLGSGLRVVLPVSIPLHEGAPFGTGPAGPSHALSGALNNLDLVTLGREDAGLRLAGIIITWNVLQHFYPYFDVVTVDWEAELDRALRGALDGGTAETYHDLLRDMAVAIRDGHAFVRDPFQERQVNPFPPLAYVDGEVLVSRADAEKKLQPGDVLLELDGIPAVETLRQEAGWISGSPQWKQAMAFRRLGSRAPGVALRVSILRKGERRELELPVPEAPLRHPPSELEPLEELPSGIFYVDLTRAPMPAIEQRLGEIAEAPGVVFDLRGYPAGNHAVLQHLKEKPISSAPFTIPQYLYPDQERIVGWEDGSWEIPPQEPRIRGCVAFLTDGRAISYAESVMEIVEHEELGEIVGGPTAGANGNVNLIPLPGGLRVSFTGMKVVKQSGQQLHTVGVQPTIPVERTKQGILEGRDEVLERALTAIESCRQEREAGEEALPPRSP